MTNISSFKVEIDNYTILRLSFNGSRIILMTVFAGINANILTIFKADLYIWTIFWLNVGDWFASKNF